MSAKIIALYNNPAVGRCIVLEKLTKLAQWIRCFELPVHY
jgi:hypothetical protein